MKTQIKEYKSLVTKYLRNQKFMVLSLAIVLAFGVGLQLINPQVSRYFIDQASKGAMAKNLIFAAIMFIGIALIQQLLNIISTYLGQNIAWKATNAIRIDLIEHCIDLDMSFHKEHQAGELIQRVDGDVCELFGLFSNVLLNVLNNLLLLIGIVVLLFKEGILIGISISIFSVLAIFLLWLVKAKTQGHWVKSSQASAEFYGFLGEELSSTEDIASCGAKKHVMNEFYKKLRKMYPIVSKAYMTWSTMWSTTMMIFTVGNIIAFAISAYLWKKGAITVGTAYLIFNYTEILRRPIEQIRVNLQELQLSGASIVRINELFDIKSKLKDGEDTLSEESLSIKLNEVNFEYEQGVKVLNNISFEVKEGRTLGILGHTGSGKTTLARLLVRLYDVNSGEVLINNKNIASISLESLSENIAYVTQNVQIFSGTIRDNITLFNKEIKDKDILDIIEALEIKEWFQRFENGLDTNLDTGSDSLSAGEAQLLAFVRIFLKNPKLIILDEATSRIDPITEKLIDKALDKLTKNRTCIIIAHRLWTLNRTDDILVLDKGEIIELGDRKKLLEDTKSKYYSLLKNGIEEVLV